MTDVSHTALIKLGGRANVHSILMILLTIQKILHVPFKLEYFRLCWI